MIARLRGRVIDKNLTHIVLDVGGVGYLIAVSAPSELTIDSETELHTYLAVRDTALDLYGFHLRDELEMFQHLLKLPKIGPKSAMQIMAQADIELLKKSIAAEDATYLSKMSGIGKKSAEKIVVGLKDTFADYVESGDTSTIRSEDGDVVEALITLGYTQKDAREVLAKLPPEAVSTNDKIREALKHIGK